MANFVKLDVKDKRILYELTINARFSYSTIAKRVKLSSNAVKNRINSLIKKGVIKCFNLGIVRPNIGIDIQFLVLLKFKNMTLEKKKSIIKKIYNIDRVLQIFEFQSKWDLCLMITCINVFELKKYLMMIKNILLNSIYDMNVLIINKQRFLQRFFFLDGLKIEPAKKYRNDGSFQNLIPKHLTFEKVIELNDLDLDILELMRNNCRLSFEEMGKILKKEPQIIKYRIIRMIKLNVIVAFAPIIDYTKLGYEKYIMFIELKGDIKRQRQLFNYLRHNPYAYDYMCSVNKWDFIVSFLSKKGSGIIDNINTKILENYSDILLEYDLLRVINEPKYEYMQKNFKNYYKIELKKNKKIRDFSQIAEWRES